MTTPEHARDPAKLRSAALGLVALGLFIAAVWLTWSFLSGGFQAGARVTAFFSEPGIGQQLRAGGDVKVRGVLVGRIIDIRLEDGAAVLELAIDSEPELPADSIAEIRSKTIFGEKWVELIPSVTAGGPSLQNGDVIDDDHTIEPLELERALELGHDLLSELPLGDLTALLEGLAGGFSGNEDAARTAIERGLVALEAVNSKSDKLDLSLRQLSEFSAWLDDNSLNLVSFMEALDRANRALVGVAPEFEASLDSVPVFLDSAGSFLERTESDLGRLAEDGADIGELVAARADRLVDIVVQLEAFTTVWNSGLSQPCSGLYEQNLTCWQVYQLPGLDSRGLYGRTTPLNDEQGDPGLRSISERPRDALFHELRSRLGARLARALVDLAGASDLRVRP
jgi:phospholipid/cholesterol/gamma-HCH transport system substrate-binding protein